jgi:hypothetical protein
MYSEEWLKKGHMKLIEFIRSLGMSQITGRIKEIFQGEVASGRSKGNPFWSITLEDDTKLTTFTEDFVSNLSQGNEYTFTVEAKGNYINMTGKSVPVLAGDEPAPATKADSGVLSNVTSSKDSERAYKNRISALQASVTYIAGAMGGTASEEEVLKTAKIFQDYIETGDVPE